MFIDFGTNRGFVFAMNTIAVFFSFTFGVSRAIAEPVYQLAWKHEYITNDYDQSLDIAADVLGNAYLAGYSTKSGSNNRGFLQKHDAAGSLLWEKQITTIEDDMVGAIYGVAADSTNVVIGGSTEGISGIDSFVSKYDSAGALQWTRAFASPMPDSVRDVSLDPGGNVFVAGNTNGPLFVPNPVSPDGFIVRYDAAGTLLWANQFSSNGQVSVWGVAADRFGNAYVTGGDGGGISNGYEIYLRKYDATGALVWNRRFGTSDSDEAYAVSTDYSGNVYIAGDVGNTFNIPDTDNVEAFIAKYDPSGTRLWYQQFGTSGDDRALDVKADVVGNIYVSVISEGALFGTGSGGPYVVKFDETGQLLWSLPVGSSNFDSYVRLAPDEFGNVFYSGNTYRSSTFNDKYVAKLVPVAEPSTVMVGVVGLLILLRSKLQDFARSRYCKLANRSRCR